MQISKRNCHASIFILAGVILIASHLPVLSEEQVFTEAVCTIGAVYIIGV